MPQPYTNKPRRCEGCQTPIALPRHTRTMRCPQCQQIYAQSRGKVQSALRYVKLKAEGPATARHCPDACVRPRPSCARSGSISRSTGRAGHGPGSFTSRPEEIPAARIIAGCNRPHRPHRPRTHRKAMEPTHSRKTRGGRLESLRTVRETISARKPARPSAPPIALPRHTRTMRCPQCQQIYAQSRGKVQSALRYVKLKAEGPATARHCPDACVRPRPSCARSGSISRSTGRAAHGPGSFTSRPEEIPAARIIACCNRPHRPHRPRTHRKAMEPTHSRKTRGGRLESLRTVRETISARKPARPSAPNL